MKLQTTSTRTTLTEIIERDLFAELNSTLRDGVLFLDKDLDALYLASKLKISAYRIPRIVKKYVGVTVPEYINRMRIEYLHQQVLTNAKWRRMTIDEMAFCAGFGSRNAFYTAYRKLFRSTPTEYINRLLREHTKIA